MGVGEDATDADATTFAQLLHLPEANFSCQRDNNAFVGEVVVAIVAATTRCTSVATSTEFKPELNNLPLTEKRFYLEKILLNR